MPLTAKKNSETLHTKTREAPVLNVDIYQLRNRAAAAEDWEMVAVCDAALGRPSGFTVLCSCSCEVARDILREEIDSRYHMRAVEQGIIEALKKSWDIE